MALLRFKCIPCNLVFKKVTNSNTSKCLRCKKDCSLLDAKPTITGITYGLPSDGPKPQASGAAGFDLEFDRAVAQNSREHWEIIKKRQEVKLNLLESNPDSTGFDMGIDPDGYYYIMSQGKKENIKELREELNEPSKVLNSKL